MLPIYLYEFVMAGYGWLRAFTTLTVTSSAKWSSIRHEQISVTSESVVIAPLKSSLRALTHTHLIQFFLAILVVLGK